MSSGIKKALSYIIPLALGAGLLYYVFNEIDLKQTWEDFKGANYVLVFFAGVLTVLSHVLRAVRWNLMLKPMGFFPSLYNSVLAVMTGYIANLIFPRAGEVTRSVSLQRSEDVPFDKSFGAVIAERVVDVLVMFVLVIVNLFLEYDRITGLFQYLFPDFSIGWILPTLAVFGVVCLFVFIRFKDKIFELPILSKFKPFFEGLKEGFTSVLNLERPWLFVLQSFLIWLLYYLSSMLLCYSIGIGASLSPLAILTVLVMGGLGMLVPTMGGIGSYHLLVSKILTLYGLSNQDGVSLATFLHTMNAIVFVLIFGSAALILNTFSRSKSKENVVNRV